MFSLVDLIKSIECIGGLEKVRNFLMKCFQEEIEEIKDSFAEVNPKGDLIEFIQHFTSKLLVQYDHHKYVL
jgi:hypothetical protein